MAPERITDGVEAALGDDPNFLNESRFSLARFRDSNLLNTLRLRLDSIEYMWNRRVVSYGEERQLELFEDWFGEVSRGKMMTVLGIASLATLAFVAFLAIRRIPPKQERQAERLYREYCTCLAGAGLPRHRGEGPRDYLVRLSKARGDLSEDLEKLTGLYMAAAYQSDARNDEPHAETLQELKQLLRELKARLGREQQRFA